MSRSKSEPNTVGLGSLPRVHEDEATELMVHHLQLAYLYYEASPESEQTKAEVLRILELSGEIDGVVAGHLAWLRHMDAVHAQLKEKD